MASGSGGGGRSKVSRRFFVRSYEMDSTKRRWGGDDRDA